MIPEGVALAAARRPAFKELIKDDPKSAIEKAVPMVVRQELPAQIVVMLETRVNDVGVLRTLQGVPMPGEPLPSGSLTFREAELKRGKTYRAHVYGRRAEVVTWVPGASLNGVAIDAEFAVSEQPTREMEVGEKVPAGKTVVTSCPVSGKSVVEVEDVPEVITTSTPAAEGATEVYLFCDGSHRDINNQTMIMGEGVSGGAFGFTGILPAAPTPALGTVKVLIIPMTYADQNTVPSTEAALYAMLRDVGDFYAKSSFGRLTLVGTVTPPVKLKHNEAWYVNRDTSNGGDISGTGVEHAEARDEARKLGFDSNDYDCIGVRHNGGPGSYGGLGGGSSVWARSDSASLWAHEIGHCFALAHANFWDTAGTSSIGAGANQEYGDSYDNMGGSPFPAGQYNAQAKSQIKWMPPSYVQSVTQSGQYRIHAMDQGVLDPARRYAMTILKDAQKTYWGEVRSLFDASNPWVKNGMILGWRYPSGSGSNIQLIDTTPGSPFLKEDAPVSLGSTFSDAESGIHMTTVAASDVPRYMDVVVNLGQFPTNQRPTLALAASSDVVPVGATVTFTATAADPDSDPLAYSWQNFGDTAIKIVSLNSPMITRTFATAGTYIVTCTVSDLKGGTTARNQLITVGNGNSRFTISGRVTLLGAGLQDVVITANGANGVVTDSDGYYTIPNLAANTYTLTPLLYGYAFGELFNNSITVGPSFSGGDFDATAQSAVNIAATTPNAGELAPVTTGRFTITRTGDNSQDLIVNVNTAQGSATITTDYTFAPAYVAGSQGFSTFTIPAGADTLDVVVTPVVDTAQEGPETVILQLGVGNGYLVGGASSAMVVINDDDTTLPKVSIAATTASTYENSGAPAVLTLTRTGTTTAALVVNYTFTSTAAFGTDYTELTGSVSIPIGASSAVVNVAPLNDALSEPLETVKLTLAANAAYLIDPLATNATASIYDDDVQIVTVAVTDATAAEVDLTVGGAQANTGTFVVTRSGDTTSALTVYYAFSGITSGVPALHGVDYEAMPGSVVIPAGQTQASVTILPRFDSIGEGPESVVLTLGAGSTNYVLGAVSAGTVTITDGTADVPYIDVVNTTSASEPSTTGTFRITLRGGTGTGALAVNYTLGGNATVTTDYTITGTSNTTTGTSITMNNGATVTKDVVVTPVNDTDLEDLENVTLSITPSATYQTYAQTATASMWLRDNDQPTVYVDTQVGTSGAWSFTEGASTSPVKFYVSRTGATTAALVVNYTIGGTATSGTDFTALSGTVTISAGSAGVDVPVVITNDTAFEGTETITFDFAAGAYSKSTGTVMYIADNDTATHTVGFSAPSSSGSESVTTVSIPVTLSAVAAGPVSVEYAVSANTSASGITNTTHTLPYWVRLVKTGGSITHYESNDGTVWTQRGSSFTVSSLGSTSYLAGIAVASGSSSTPTTATVDNLSVTGLEAGGAAGVETSANIGNAGPGGTHSFASGVYSFNTPGSSIASSSTTDNFRFVYVPVTNSANCTITARLSAMSATSSSARIGVMLRSTTAQGSVYAASLANGSGGFLTSNRTTTSTASNAPSTITTPVLPQWFRLVRAGDVFTSSFSKDGVVWANLGTSPSQTIAAGPTVLAGLAVSAASDGLLAAATFDNVSIVPAPAGALLGRTVGFVNEQGGESFSGGEWTVTGSGAGIGTTDEAHYVATDVSGDFTLIARVTSLVDGGAGAQAGVMIRDGRNHYSRHMHGGWVKSGGVEQRYRLQSVTTAFGTGVDFLLPPGTLTFEPGDLTKDISFTVVNDSMDEPNNLITLQLTNAVGANVLAAGTYHGYTILDDDTAPAQPYVGFASATSAAAESSVTSVITVSLSAPATAACSVDFAVTGGTATNGGTDYDLVAGTLNFAVGESVKAIPLTINDDAIIDAAETVIVTFSNLSGLQQGSISSHILTITDNDLPVVSIVANDANASEAALNPGQFTVTRTGPTTAALTVVLARTGTATSGTDYTAIATPLNLSIPIGASSAVVNVTLTANDTTNEGSETVIETINANAAYTIGTPSSATVTIADDDRSTVTLVANDDTASETAGNPGQFTVTRTAPTNVALTVNLTIAGNATNTTDYANVAATVAFVSGDVSKTVNIAPVDDSDTEGPEQVTISLSTGTYDIGAQSFDNVTILDNDNPPVLFIDSPTTQGPLVANGNGIILSATITDDGTPAPVTQTWTQISGPGTATIESPNAATTAVTFSAPGTYILRITATDTQFTVSDQVTVVVGSALVAADWITQDMGPSSARRGQGIEFGGLFTVTGTGAGYSAVTTDQAHIMVRQISGDGSIVARLTSLPVSTALAGVTMRDSMTRGARRAVLGFVPGTGLQFRARTTVSVSDTVVATQTGLSLPLWLKLERNATTGDVIASYGSDGIAWTQLGATTAITMDALADTGLTTTSNSTSSSATAVFDNVTLTPAPSGPALLTEDSGATPAAAGSSSLAGSTYTVNGSTSGYFHGWQYYGDMIVTARLATFTSGAGSASGGIRIAESMESGGQLHLGRMPTGSYNGYYWTSIAGGTGGGVPSGIASGNWMRFIRKGNSITGYRAADVSGSPGAWIQIGQPQTVIMTTPVWVGFYVNNASGVGLNTCTFSGLSIAPLNKAPIVDTGTLPASIVTPLALNATVTDDNYPAPVSLTTLWTRPSGASAVTFGDSALIDTTATFTAEGAFKFRLFANDGGLQSFDDLLFTGYLTPWSAWQGAQFPGGSSNPSAAMLLDPDFDGQCNLLEYASGTDPETSAPSNVVQDSVTVSSQKYLRLTVTKNPTATDVTYEVQATSDLTDANSWSSAGLVIEANTSTQLRVRDNVAMSGGVRRFMRVLVTR